MFRYERPQKGRQRQFHQLGVEYLGTPQSLADVEVISLAQTLLEKLRIADCSLHINSIGDIESRKSFREALVSYLNQYKNDLSEDSQKRLLTNPLRILDSKDVNDQKIIQDAPVLSEHLNDHSKAIFDSVLAGLNQLKIPYQVNPNLVRGLDYYCHSVFEFKHHGLGAQDTLLAGGRYDGLIQIMGGPETPAVGFAAGVERLSLVIDTPTLRARPVFVLALGAETESTCLQISHNLRKQGIYAEMPFSGNASKQMKKASKANARIAILIGEDELKCNEATIKDLDQGTQIRMPIDKIQQHIQQILNS